MIGTLFGVVLALLAVGFIAYPLLREQLGDDETFDLPEDLEVLLRRKESTYSALKELEFDFKTGKLSEGDFHELDARYRADALEILAAIDARDRGASGAAGSRKGKVGGQKAGAAPACAECGETLKPGQRFCASCGAEVQD
ncbi:MAG TPA: zinc ribbon domain-containing protein [Thermoleophilia bacterium]|nr:zinc ribbon domain-containing protein [Thermoleophilia bacterium]